MHLCNATSEDNEQPTPVLSTDDLRPTCVNILRIDDHMKDLTLYNAELYNGEYDGMCNNNLTIIDTDEVETISTTQMYTSINLAQLHDTSLTVININDLVQRDPKT